MFTRNTIQPARRAHRPGAPVLVPGWRGWRVFGELEGRETPLCQKSNLFPPWTLAHPRARGSRRKPSVENKKIWCRYFLRHLSKHVSLAGHNLDLPPPPPHGGGSQARAVKLLLARSAGLAARPLLSNLREPREADGRSRWLVGKKLGLDQSELVGRTIVIRAEHPHGEGGGSRS